MLDNNFYWMSFFINPNMTTLLAYAFTCIGALVAFFVIKTDKTLARAPFLVAFGLVLMVEALIGFIIYNVMGTIASAQTIMPVVLYGLSLISGFVVMILCVMRAQDGFRTRNAALLILLPIFCWGLFTISEDDDPEEQAIIRNPVMTHPLLNNLSGVVIGTVLALIGFWLLQYLHLLYQNLI